MGAGIAGLNALFVASQYLSRDQKVILVDRRQRVGGMWVDTYPYVRLHQPHAMFTAGNIKWTLGQDRSYLATKGEVLDHFEHCLNVIKQRVQVDEFFGWTLESHDETDGIVRITCRSSDGQLLVVEAKRLIKAYGFRVVPNDPLEISSERVQSVSPDFCDMRGDEMRASDTPVWIIGGGKTAMDTAHALITEYPGREVNLVAGSGTFFLNRDRFFPAGARRWWGGKHLEQSRPGSVSSFRRHQRDRCRELVSRYLRHVVNPRDRQLPAGRAFRIGEQDDRRRPERRDHGPPRGCRRPQRRHRAGVPKRVHQGDPTGQLDRELHGIRLPRRPRPYEPYVSPSGAVLSIQPRSATLHLTSFMGYFMTHLLFLGKIRDIPLYELDMQDLRKKSNAAFPYRAFTLAQYNLSLISDSVPTKVFLDCGLDFDRWYPLPRRMVEYGAVHAARTAANASTSAAPSTPCANGSTFGAARYSLASRSPRQIERLAAGWAANQSSSRSAIVSGCSSRIQCETPLRTSKRYSPTT